MIADVLREHLESSTFSRKCKMGLWLEEQDSDVVSLFNEIASRPQVNITAIYHSLVNDLPFKSTTFKLHIKGTCTCPKAS
jgi:hypothetical protein